MKPADATATTAVQTAVPHHPPHPLSVQTGHSTTMLAELWPAMIRSPAILILFRQLPAATPVAGRVAGPVAGRVAGQDATVRPPCQSILAHALVLALLQAPPAVQTALA